ncbi:Exostosin domain-containing protein [Cephalotus follicularis]|uniref:Exostosin domain-containing protein n=1 Tax=Cephalotus follicularis TaxID=3775 RepID=A0A1Q3D3Q6_CEPFO|nr:Exostosin domain-containing protein [Cephalotus follicularis]
MVLLEMLCLRKGKRRSKQQPLHLLHLHHRKIQLLLALLLLLLLLAALAVWSRFSTSLSRYGYKYNSFQPHFHPKTNHTIKTKTHHQNTSSSSSSWEWNSANEKTAPQVGQPHSDPYHNWHLFATDFGEMLQNFKIFVYADVFVTKNNSFADIFLPHPNPFNPKGGNYFSEHIFKVALLNSSLITLDPKQANLFFLPFSINKLRNDPRVHFEVSISDFVAGYTNKIRHEFPFWNASGGADHFYVHCHSVGREAASKHHDLHNNAIQVTCSSSYFQRLYVTHKDVALPQVWPRQHHIPLVPPHARHKLVYYSGRVQNSAIRQELMTLWGNDTDMDLFNGRPPFPYEEGFRRSKYCLHVKGYEVNTARLSDAIHYGCIPVIISNYYDLPFANVLDWAKFSVTINQREIALLKKRVLSITKQDYLSMYHNLCHVRKHFVWHTAPRDYDSFYMTAYQLWLRRSTHRLSH